MMLFGFRGLSDDSTTGTILDSIPGVDSAITYVQGKAKEGAEGAIPDIQNQVKTAITPYIVTIGIIGGLGLLFGLSAYMKINKMTARST